MQKQDGCSTGKQRILIGIATAAATAGTVLLIGPATDGVAANGMPLHQAMIGGGLIGLAGMVFVAGCWRGEASIFRSLESDMAQALADERLNEAQRIIDEAARSAPSDKPASR